MGGNIAPVINPARPNATKVRKTVVIKEETGHRPERGDISDYLGDLDGGQEDEGKGTAKVSQGRL
ncbi:MAG TPA: hypothetical protein VJT11_00035 [Nitrospiraceae bacterium]|nr:hypothetical protein [Nitrospiraceae bacterium]